MPTSPLRRLAGDTAIYGMGTIVPRLLNYFLVPFYTRIFDEGPYGQITELYAWVAIIMVILTYGMETSFFRYAILEKKAESVFNTSAGSILLTSLFFIFLVSIFLSDISSALQYADHKDFIAVLAIVVTIDAFTALPFAYLRLQKKAKRFSLIRIVSVLVNVFLNFLFLLIIPRHFGEQINNWSVYSSQNMIGLVFVANLFSSLVTLFMLVPELRNFKLKIDLVLLKKMLAYGLPILIIGIAGMINEVSDKILLRYFLPDHLSAEIEIGIYGANYKLAILMTLFIQMFRYAAEPFFFAEANNKDAKENYSRIMTYFVIFMWLIFLSVTLYIDVFKYFIGPKFWAGLSVVPIVLIAKLFLGVYFNLSIWYKLTNKTFYGSLVALAGACFTIALNILWIPVYGYVGSAWASLITYFIITTISYIWGQKKYKVDYNLKKLFAYSGLALSFYFISLIFNDYSILIHFTVNTLLLMGYLTLIYFFEIRKLLKKA
jgi:O-antigen/teichoic acid export membrane protein